MSKERSIEMPRSPHGEGIPLLSHLTEEDWM
jgi:hypothetical protein